MTTDSLNAPNILPAYFENWAKVHNLRLERDPDSNEYQNIRTQLAFLAWSYAASFDDKKVRTQAGNQVFFEQWASNHHLPLDKHRLDNTYLDFNTRTAYSAWLVRRIGKLSPSII